MMPPPLQTIEIVLADDHELVRSGIKSLLSAMEGVRVIAEARDGEELLAVLELVRPDVVVTDITMPGMDGITALTKIRERHPELRVMVLSMHDSPEAVRQAVAHGACAYVRKDATAYELEIALRNVVRTGSHFDANEARLLLESSAPAPGELLTERQVEVLILLARGKSSKEIAFELGLSSKTVDVHRTHIMERLALHDLPNLTLYAVRKGLISL